MHILSGKGRVVYPDLEKTRSSPRLVWGGEKWGREALGVAWGGTRRGKAKKGRKQFGQGKRGNHRAFPDTEFKTKRVPTN